MQPSGLGFAKEPKHRRNVGDPKFCRPNHFAPILPIEQVCVLVWLGARLTALPEFRSIDRQPRSRAMPTDGLAV